ncbi:MAG: SDR family NAD(P)-dependent oxidoreductase, partial [Bacteroidota bacterium]
MDTNFIVGQTAIITGVSRGLGKAIATQLLDKGATVIGWGRTQPTYTHSNFYFLDCEVYKPDSVQQAWKNSQKISP